MIDSGTVLLPLLLYNILYITMYLSILVLMDVMHCLVIVITAAAKDISE